MAFSVAAAPNYGNQAYTITGVIQRLGAPNPPATIAFPSLGGGGIPLTTGLGAPIIFDTERTIVRSVGLLSCASVCYVSNNGRGYVYHANVGTVSEDEFNVALGAIGAPPAANVYIAVAHPDATAATYQQTIANFVLWGIPTNNIVEITHLLLGSFGLNNEFQIGY